MTGLLQATRSAPLRQSLVSVLRWSGIDRAVLYTLAGRGWGVIATPVTWFLIGRYLLPAEQGFYYTFGSIIALNIFLELGLTFVLLQFASHEKAHLEWTASGTLAGSEIAQSRLAALLRMALKWYGVAALLVLLLVMPAGIAFFSRNPLPTPVDWRWPWILLATVSAVNLLSTPLLAILEGCGKVSQIAFLRFGQSILAYAGLWLTLRLHGALFASPVFQAINVISALVWLSFKHRRFFKTLLRTNVAGGPLHWLAEVWPFQWRIALSWLSGYFVSQLFNPVLFATHGPVVAGQMGMSLSISSALLAVSFAWMSTKASPFGVLVARRQWKALDELFFRTVQQSLFVLVLCSIIVFAGIVGLHHIGYPFSKRLLSPVPVGFLLLSVFMNHLVYSEALYLRTHKAEPFLVQSVVVGVLTAISTLAFAERFGALGVSVINLACCTVGLVMGTIVFQKKRREWHV